LALIDHAGRAYGQGFDDFGHKFIVQGAGFIVEARIKPVAGVGGNNGMCGNSVQGKPVIIGAGK
jgi:hypothetical protein